MAAYINIVQVQHISQPASTTQQKKKMSKKKTGGGGGGGGCENIS